MLSIKGFQAFVRPAVTAGLVGSQVVLAMIWALCTPEAKEPFNALVPFTMMAVTYWFKTRETEK